MKLIEINKSPNFNIRKKNRKISYIILHYTAMKTYKDAINRLCNKKYKVSVHFLISKKGDIYRIVDENKRAWHAGVSYWKRLIDLNSSSIGIEIDNQGKEDKFTNLQIKSLCTLLKKIIIKYNIPLINVLGHSDIAPFRKKDPGKNFPWQILVKKKLAYFPNINSRNLSKISNKYKDHSYILYMLRNIGYDTRGIKEKNLKYKKLIKTYQMHYRKSNISGKIDMETLALIEQHHKDVLT